MTTEAGPEAGASPSQTAVQDPVLVSLMRLEGSIIRLEGSVEAIKEGQQQLREELRDFKAETREDVNTLRTELKDGLKDANLRSDRQFHTILAMGTALAVAMMGIFAASNFF